MNDNIRVFQDALFRIQRGWCQRFISCDANNLYVSPESREAIKWSLCGSLAHDEKDYWVDRKILFEDVFKAIKQLELHIPRTPDLHAWNDHRTRTHQQVIEVLELCIHLQSRNG